MNSFEFPGTNDPTTKKKNSGLVWNVLTILVLVTILCVVSVVLLIFQNPYSAINPFPPPTLNPTVLPPTATITPRITLIPSWTPTNALTESTNTPQAANIPSNTEIPSETVTAIEATPIPPAGGFSFVARQGSPSAIDGAAFHPEAGCNWLGVAGQATSLNGESVKGLFVQLGGSLPGVENIETLAMTGLAPQYGAGGFEFTLAYKMIASDDTLWVQLLDQQNLALSDRIYFDTYDDCQKNLIIIYFDQVK